MRLITSNTHAFILLQYGKNIKPIRKEAIKPSQQDVETLARSSSPTRPCGY